MGLWVVTGGEDQVIAGVPVPDGGSVLQVQGFVDIMVNARMKLDEMCGYSLNMYMIPLSDFDSVQTYDVLWDTMVPKDDTDDDLLDLDEGAPDTAPEEEPGDPDLETILGIHGTPLTRMFHRNTLFTYANNPRHAHLDTNHYYWPSERVPINIKRRVFANGPSMCLFGFSSPTMDITTTSLRSTPVLKDWGRMQFIQDTLRDMLKNALGLVEAGATTPYVDAQSFLVDLLESNVIEESLAADNLLSVAYNLFTRLNFKVDMPENNGKSELTSG